MEDLTKINRIIAFYDNIQNALKNETYDIEKLNVIMTVSHIYENIVEVFDYDFNRFYNSIIKLDDCNIFSGDVYKIFEKGSLKNDGYEKGYLFLYEGSSVLEHIHINEKEHYKCICGDMRSISKSFCNINSSHKITEVNTDTLVRTYKYIPKKMIK